jgi:hypothetical protein
MMKHLDEEIEPVAGVTGGGLLCRDAEKKHHPWSDRRDPDSIRRVDAAELRARA